MSNIRIIKRDDYMSDDTVELKVDVGVLKQKVINITELCAKMDTIIEKLVEQHGRYIEKVYVDMEKSRLETETEINKIHSRIEVIIDKMQDSEHRLLAEMKSMKSDFDMSNKKQKEALAKLLEWKWAIVGGVVAIGWLISHIKLDTLSTLIAPATGAVLR